MVWAPSLEKASAIAKPIVPEPPVIITILPWNLGGAPFPSLACSSDQYSQSNKSFSEIGLNPPASSPIALTRAF